VRRRLADLDLLSPSASVGRIFPYVTDEASRFARVARQFLGFSIGKAEQIQLKEMPAE
jgi:hypothetical protein